MFVKKRFGNALLNSEMRCYLLETRCHKLRLLRSVMRIPGQLNISMIAYIKFYNCNDTVYVDNRMHYHYKLIKIKINSNSFGNKNF